MTRILSIASVSDWNTRYLSPRHALSICWNSGACMIAFICADSFLSNCAIISSIVSRTSVLMRLVSDSACSTRVLTAFSTSVAARSVRGLQLFFQICSNSSPSRVSTWVSRPRAVVSVAMDDFSGYGLRSGIAFALAARLRSAVFQGRHQLRIGQQFAQRLLRRDLAVHVAGQIGELLSRLEQLGKRRHLSRDRRRLEVRHLVEAQIDAHLLRGIVGELVFDPEADAGLDCRHAA